MSLVSMRFPVGKRMLSPVCRGEIERYRVGKIAAQGSL